LNEQERLRYPSSPRSDNKQVSNAKLFVNLRVCYCFRSHIFCGSLEPTLSDFHSTTVRRRDLCHMLILHRFQPRPKVHGERPRDAHLRVIRDTKVTKNPSLLPSVCIGVTTIHRHRDTVNPHQGFDPQDVHVLDRAILCNSSSSNNGDGRGAFLLIVNTSVLSLLSSRRAVIRFWPFSVELSSHHLLN
jgi:hypothetical protein